MTFTEFAQVLAAIGTVSAPWITALGPRLMDRLHGKSAASPSDTVLSEQVSSGTKATTQESLFAQPAALDLSITLLCSAFFGSIIADALLVSGQPTHQTTAFIAEVCGIALLTTLGAILAWFCKRAEWGIGIMALFCMAALLLAKGGPFIKAEGNAPGIPVYIPLFVLVTLISTWIFFVRRQPAEQFSKLGRKRATRGVMLGLLLIAGLATLSSGKQLAEAVSNLNDENIPHFAAHDLDKVNSLLKTLHNSDYAYRSQFYRYASEITLATMYYREQYNLYSTANSSTQSLRDREAAAAVKSKTLV